MLHPSLEHQLRIEALVNRYHIKAIIICYHIKRILTLLHLFAMPKTNARARLLKAILCHYYTEPLYDALRMTSDRF